ncbi:MAG: molecular chaperone DnaJ [Gemmatimonadota bacterium]|nr:molecular chaperone DnaJ [Gemmatimonadota bacterium]
MAQTKDYYAVLGVSASATQDEIKKQYRRLAKRYHPDANQNDAKAADRFKEIAEAYNVLGDTGRRKQYDEMRRLGAFGGFGGFGGARPGPGQPAGTGASGGIRFEEFDIGGLGGLGDLFSSMFGGGARAGTRPGGAERGQTVEMTLELPFRTAALGGKVPVHLEVTEECGTCHGNGAAAGATFRQCPECSGRGTVSFGQGGFAVTRPCPMCLGRGQIPSQRCATCGGSGEVRARRTVMIAVPPGVDSGSKVRLSGQGGKGGSGGQAGDLLITFQVQPDRFFRREGLDIVATVPLNIAQATLGSKISVRAIDGRKVAIRIPPGTPSGKRFRVRGQGIAKNGTRGDMIIETAINVPARLSPQQEQAMREFANAGGMKY